MGIIYKVPGNLKGPKGTTYSWKDAGDGDKLPEGWHSSLTDAIEAQQDKPKRKRRTKAEIEASKAENS